MADVFHAVAGERRQRDRPRRTAARAVRRSMEGVVLALVCLSPWAYGSVWPDHEFLLHVGVATLAVLWGVLLLLDGKVPWQGWSGELCLAALLMIGVLQMVPLP